MSVLTKPQGSITLGWAQVQGQRVPVTIDIEWDRFLSVLTARAGGVIGVSTTELEASKQDIDEKGVANGYAGLGATALVPTAQLGTGTANGAKVLYGDGTWGALPAGAEWTEVEIDFGSDPVYEATFSITDASITVASKVALMASGKAATGRTADDWQWDAGVFAATPGSGSATCYAQFLPGPIVGRRTLQYQIG